jgi:cobalt-zinc-cadmium efflux system outer membrane protein
MYLAICVALGGLARAQDSPPGLAGALTLDAAIEIALARNPELRAFGGHVDAAAGRAYQAGLWPNPELELSAEEWPIGRGLSDAKRTIGVAQTLPFPGKKSLDHRIGMAGVQLSEAELLLRRAELVRDVKAAFYRVLVAERLVDAAGDLAKIAESSADAARQRVEAGAAADQELLRAEILLEQAQASRADSQRELSVARQNLAARLGWPDLRGTGVSGALAESPNEELLRQEPDPWLAGHPSAIAARTARDRAELQLRRARLEPYPDIRVGVAGGHLGDTDESIVELRFSLPLPLLDGGKGVRQEARALIVIAESELTSIERQLLHEWTAASQRLRAAGEQVDSYKDRILPRTERALELVRAGFEQGKFGLIDLLDTQRTTAEVRLAYQQKLLELNVAQAELEALMAGASQPPADGAARTASESPNITLIENTKP